MNDEQTTKVEKLNKAIEYGQEMLDVLQKEKNGLYKTTN